MAELRTSFWQRHRWLAWTGGTALTVLVVVIVVLAIAAHRVEPYLRARIIAGLQDRFHTRVELDSFHVRPGNGMHGQWGIWATGKGLRIWPPQHTGGDRPLETAMQSLPLIDLGEFKFHVPLRRDSSKPMRISRIELTGLAIHVPPRSERNKQTGIESAMTKPAGSAAEAAGTARAPASASLPAYAGTLSNIVVERIDCDHAQLLLETDKPDKLPLGFAIEHLRLTDVSAGQPIHFEAYLTNPRPRGLIHTTGSFGPWQMTDPGESPMSGAYRFEHADLSAFNSIAGILTSTGNFEGTLRDIIVDGEAQVPDFRLTHFGNTMFLQTRFHARVDGTDGDTWLEPVEATLGRSHFITQGQVVRNKPPQSSAGSTLSGTTHAALFEGGHIIDLKVNIDRGRVEDFLRLTSNSPTPMLTGDIVVKATLHVPPGKDLVHQRMNLDGNFKLDNAHFASTKVQDRIMELSLRGQGRPGDLRNSDANSIDSQMQGSFTMANGVITIPDLKYAVPGATIQLKGTYSLDGSMYFDGNARMQATVSEMVGGWKGFLLKPADRFFKRDGAGTLVGIQVRGVHNQPEFGIDLSHVGQTSPETPGQKEP